MHARRQGQGRGADAADCLVSRIATVTGRAAGALGGQDGGVRVWRLDTNRLCGGGRGVNAHVLL